MSKRATPPRAYEVQSGAWNVDIYDDTSIVLFGDKSVKFDGDGLEEKLLISSQPIPVTGDTPYELETHARSSNATDNLVGRVKWLDQNLSSVGTLQFAEPADAATTWAIHNALGSSPSGARFAKLEFGISANSFSAWFADVRLRDARRAARIRLDTNQTGLSKAAWDVIEFDKKVYDHGGLLELNSGVYRFRTKKRGLYLVQATALLDIAGADSTSIIGLQVNGSTVVDGTRIDAEPDHVGIAHNLSTVLSLGRDDYIEPAILVSDGDPSTTILATTGSTERTYATVTQLTP